MGEETLQLLIRQLERQAKTVEKCQTLLTGAVVICVIAIVIMLFIIFKGKGVFTKDKIIIGDDKEALHNDVIRLTLLSEDLKKEISKLKNVKKQEI